MAEEQQFQSGRRVTRRGVSSITRLENNVAQLIAEDMRHLELEDAAAARDTNSISTVACNSRHEAVSNSRTTLEERAAGATAEEATDRARTTETNRSQRTDISSRGDNASDTSEHTRPWTDTSRRRACETSDRTRPWTDRLHRNETGTESSSTGSSWRDRLGREQTTQNSTTRPWTDRLSQADTTTTRRESTTSTRASTSTESAGQEYVAGSYRRGSWRDRLGMAEVAVAATAMPTSATPTSATSTPERASHWGGTQEYVPGSYRRGSWRDRLNRELSEDTAETASASRYRSSISGDTQASSRHRSSISGDLTQGSSASRHRSSIRGDTAEASILSRQRSSISGDTGEASVSSRHRSSLSDSTQEAYVSSRHRSSISGDTREASVSSRHRSSISDSPQEYVPGSYRRGSWREKLGREDSSTTTSTRPWRERLNRSETTYDVPSEPSTDRPSTEESTPSDEVGAYRRGSWRERLQRDENDRTAFRNDQESHSSESDTPAVSNRGPVVPEAQAERAENVAHGGHEVVDGNNDLGQNNSEEDLARASNENTEGETSDKKEGEKSWTEEDVLKLLVKAINYRTPLKDLETILKWRLDVNIAHKNGLRALHYAAYTNYVNCVELLLNHGANINITDDIGYTPLHLAARCGHYKTIHKLIENGAMITFNEPGVEIRGMDAKNKLGFTSAEPINLAVQNGHPECAELLLKHGARPDNKYFMGYEISLCPLDDTRCIEVLLRHGASPNVFNRCGVSPLMKACKDHRIDVVRLLLQHGADHNAQCPPLFEQKSVIQVAIDSGNIVIVNLILFKNPKLSRNENYGYSALHTAIMKGRSDMCRLLLQKQADPEERTEAGATPLMLACSYAGVRERREVVQMLLDCGADVNAFGENFSYVDPYLTPMAEYLKTIGSAESFSIVELLISNGARIHFTSGDVLLGGRRDPFSILHFAHVLWGSPDMLELVLQAAQRFSPLAIHACDSLPDGMKNLLLELATSPLSLKHTVRLALRNMLMPDMLDNVMDMPLPPLIQNYLLLGLNQQTPAPEVTNNTEDAS